MSKLPGGVADGLVEDGQAERELVLGGGQGRGDPEDAPHAGQLHDVHVQAQFEAASGDQRAQLVGASLGLAVDDQFQAGQQAASADVTDDFVPVRDLLEALPQDAAQMAGALVEPVALQHVEDRVPDGGRQRICRRVW